MTSEERNDDVLAKSNDSEPSSKQEGFVGQTILLKSGLSGSFTYPLWRGPPSLTAYTNQDDTSGAINPNAQSYGRLSYASNSRDLILKNANVNDSGEYKCSYTGLGEHSIILEVKEKNYQTITPVSKKDNICVGDNVTLDWYYGDPSNFMSVTWKYVDSSSKETAIMSMTVFDSNATVCGEYNVVHNGNGAITLTNVELSNSGSYKIIVSYLSGVVVESTVEVTIKECKNDGLSNGEKAGIVIGSVVVPAGIVVLLIFIWKKFVNNNANY